MARTILLLHCPDQKGIITDVTGFITRNSGNILYLDQYVDRLDERLFMRIEWDLDGFAIPREQIYDELQSQLGSRYSMDAHIFFSDVKPRMAIFVSKMSHCLYDLLARYQAGEWEVEIPCIVSNHEDLRYVAEQFGIPFYVWSINPDKSNREEVERYSRLPILGESPQRSETRQELIISSSGADNVMLEAFRMLRQNLEFVRGHGHVMLITSSTPGQGKSFVSRNLAATCALTGKRVLLIDADIRKLTQSHLAIGTKESTGLTNYLQGGIGPDEIIMKDGLTNGVDFIPGGSVPPNPAELLMRPTLKALLAYVRPRYDYIFIDTTPAFAVADAQTLAHQSDLTLYVVRIGVENRMLLPNLDRIAQEGKFPRMNYVINGVKADYTDYENSGNQNLSQSALLQKLRQWLQKSKE